MRRMWLVCVASVCVCAAAGFEPAHLESEDNSTDINKDMYLVHAVVFEVGIITNASDDNVTDDHSNHTGSQESLTLYRQHGAKVDLRGLPAPLLTNVTSQSYVGVAPAPAAPAPAGDWSMAGDDADATKRLPITRRQTEENGEFPAPPPTEEQPPEGDDSPWWSVGGEDRSGRQAGAAGGGQLVRVETGRATSPVSALTLPALNSTLAEIPLPVPNTALLTYARINTLIMPANSTS